MCIDSVCDNLQDNLIWVTAKTIFFNSQKLIE